MNKESKIKPLEPKSKTVSKKKFENQANQFSFSRASRFPISKENTDPTPFIFPSTLSTKSCSFGLGKRWEPKPSHCQDSPCPTTYMLKSFFNQENHSLDYKRQSLKGREFNYIKLVPGPGAYDPTSPSKKQSPGCLLIGKKFIRSMSVVPSPGFYNPCYKLSHRKLSLNLSFSKAKRKDIHKL